MFRTLLPGLLLSHLLLPGWPVSAQEPIRLEERFFEGQRYHVSARVDLAGTVTTPGEKGQAARTIKLQGDSAFEYDERILTVAEGQVRRALRQCQRLELERTFGGRAQQNILRPGVRRLVVLREKQAKEPFSPDGPLLFTEIDLVRNDVFVPVLLGLMPDQPVLPGQRWMAGTEAVQELTGLTKIEDGKLECQLEPLTAAPGQRRQARVSFTGTVRGTGEGGRSIQQLQGYYLFDLDARYLTYVFLKGSHVLLDKDNKEGGRLDGRFVLSRSLVGRFAELSDEALKGVKLEPDADNTRVLYDNPELGVRFQYARRWWITGVRGNQITMDTAEGHGLLLTLEPAAKSPTAGQFLKETQEWLAGQKARILRVDPVRTLPGTPVMEHFGLEAEMGGQKFLMDYFLLRQGQTGILLAARLLPGNQDVIRLEVERLARSLSLTK